MTPARNSVTGTPWAARCRAGLLPAAQVRRQRVVGGAEAAEVDDPLDPGVARRAGEVAAACRSRSAKPAPRRPWSGSGSRPPRRLPGRATGSRGGGRRRRPPPPRASGPRSAPGPGRGSARGGHAAAAGPPAGRRCSRSLPSPGSGTRGSSSFHRKGAKVAKKYYRCRNPGTDCSNGASAPPGRVPGNPDPSAFPGPYRAGGGAGAGASAGAGTNSMSISRPPIRRATRL